MILLYYKKVEITGINSSDLPVLTERERENLILKMKNGDRKAKDTLMQATTCKNLWKAQVMKKPVKRDLRNYACGQKIAKK